MMSVLMLAAAVPPARAVSPPAALNPTTILIDAQTGQTLREQDADAARPAGSLSQLMVLLLSLEAVDAGALPPDLPTTVSAAALAAPGARVPLRAEKVYPLDDLLKAMTLDAANDAAIAAAEAVAGSVPACLELMNARAQKLGMQTTQYATIGGMAGGSAVPDTTTARDLARLAQALAQHRQVLQWASLAGLPFDQGSILLRNVNHLVGAVAGVDGLQVSSSGAVAGRGPSFSIVATAQRGALRLIAVVLDAADSTTRYNAAAELLEWGFAHYERLDVVREGEPVALPIRVVDGSVSQLTPVAGQTFSLLRRRDEERNLQIRYQLPTLITPPLQRHEAIGEVIIEEKGQLVAVVPVLSPSKIVSTRILSAALP